MTHTPSLTPCEQNLLVISPLVSMAYSISQSHSSAAAAAGLIGEPRRLSQLSSASSLLKGTPLFCSVKRSIAQSRRRFRSAYAKSLDHIPKEFRRENLKDELLENYRNFPKDLCGLAPAQLGMFMNKGNPYQRLAETIPKESLSFMGSYTNHTKSLSGYSGSGPRNSMWDGTIITEPEDGEEHAPPDLPSLLLDARIVYLALPIVPEVTELIVAQFIYLNNYRRSQPIYLYINCEGTQNEKHEPIGPDTDAYAIADVMAMVKPDVYTINLGMAYGQAAMLLALGKKGKRGVVSTSFTTLRLPTSHPSSGQSSYMWTLGQEMDTVTEYYLELLEKGIGKPREEIYRDIQSGNSSFTAQEAIDYGIADIILTQEHLYGVKKKKSGKSMKRWT